MSYNIDNCEYISGGPLRIKRSTARELLEEHKRELPEDNFLGNLNLSYKKDPDEILEIKLPSWRGMGSGNTYDLLQKKILPKTEGSAAILFIWEGGDSKTALKVKDGEVTEKKVRITIDD